MTQLPAAGVRIMTSSASTMSVWGRIVREATGVRLTWQQLEEDLHSEKVSN